MEEAIEIKVVRNTSRADRVIDFIERNLKVTIGKKRGHPFLLTEWQKAFIRDVYEPEDEDLPGIRLVTQAVFSVGRKNGKSELAAALVLAHLIGPECETNGEIVSGATTAKQARMVFNSVVRFINASRKPGQPKSGLAQYLRVVDSTSTVFVTASGIKAEGSRYVAIPAGPGAAQGLNPSLIIMDELAQANNRNFFDALAESQGARDQPFMMVISTQAADPQHVLSTTIDDGLRRRSNAPADCGCQVNRSCSTCSIDPRTVVHLYAAEEGCDLNNEKGWRDANPALDDGENGGWIDYKRFAARAAKALRNPADEASFRLYRLNQRVSPNAPLVSTFDWRACGPSTPQIMLRQDTFQFEPGEKLYGGLDLSKRDDLTALAMVSAEAPARVKAWFWKPGELILRHGERDGQRYDLHRDNGWLIASPGRMIHPGLVARKIAELHGRYAIQAIAYDRDPTHMTELLNIMADEGLTAQNGDGHGLRMEPWGQSFVGMNPAVNALHSAILYERADGSRGLQHDGNPLLSWNMMNAMVDEDTKENRKLVKMNPRFRIDGAVALAMAMGLRMIDRPVTVANPWENPSFSLFGDNRAA